MKLRIWWSKSVEVCCASLCGVFVSLGLLSFAEGDVSFWDRAVLVRAAVVTLFALTSIFGIYGRPRLLPKACFALSQATAAFLLPQQRHELALVQLVLYPLLLMLLLLGARWRGRRFAALLLTLMLAFGLPPRRVPPPLRGMPESLYLPASLATESSGGWMLLFCDSVSDELLDALAHRDGWVQMNSPRLALDIFLKWYHRSEVKIAVAGDAERFTGKLLRRGVYRWLVGKLASDGVLVMPFDETELLPSGDWRFSALPGGGGEWVAARRGRAASVDPETLDGRMREFSLRLEHPVLPDGAISAMYPPAVGRAPVPPPRKLRIWGDSWQWGLLAAVAILWVILRLLLCRRAHAGTAAAALATTAAMTLYSLAMLPKWSGFMLDTGVMPSALFAGLGVLLLPRRSSASRSGILKLMGMIVGVLPWLPGFGCRWLPLVSWFLWFLAGAAVFSGLRAEHRRAALLGAVFGVAAGGLLWWGIGSDGSCLPICVAALLMLPLSQRR